MAVFILTTHNPIAFDKLTPKENKIIYALQQGYVLCTSNESRIVVCAGDGGKQFEFSSNLFYRLYGKGLIGQRSAHPQNYEPSLAGTLYKTKPVKLP